jgi:hypothetical protein
MLRYCLAACAFLLLLTVAPAASAQTIDASQEPRVRTTDRRLRTLIEEGVRHSPTFRSLVQRLAESDVVVYVQTEPRWPTHVDGRLTFASAAGGYRYVVVRLRDQGSRLRMLALIGHELRHAVEVAETPAIVDGASFAREYQRLGYMTRGGAETAAAFDTEAAVEAGYQVLAELQPGEPQTATRRGRRALASVGALRRFGAGTEMNP